MQNKEIEEAKEYFKRRIDICLENAEICDENNFDEEATCLRKEQILTENILQYINQLENKVKELDKGQHTLMQSRRKWKNRYYKERRKRKEVNKEIQTIINVLKTRYEQLTQSVRRHEDMRRNCNDEFYLKSYQTTIHKLNAKRETISNILDIIIKEIKENEKNVARVVMFDDMTKK